MHDRRWSSPRIEARGGTALQGSARPAPIAAGRRARAPSGNHGEPARIERDRRGEPSRFWLAGMKLLPEGNAAKELTARYAPLTQAAPRNASQSITPPSLARPA